MMFLDGRFVSEGAATVSAFDAGLMHGVGLFETMSATLSGGEARVHFLEEHLERLLESARELGLTSELHPGGLADAVVTTVERAGHERARVRLTVTGGDLNLLNVARDGAREGAREAARDEAREDAGQAGGEARRDARAGVRPTVMVHAQPATPYPPEMFDRGVTVSVAGTRVNPLCRFEGHKTLNYWWRLAELRSAAGKGAGEALVFQVTNFLAGGCVSNCFVVRGGRLVTPMARGEEEGPPGSGPRLASPVLPGITREFVLNWANENRVPVERRMVTFEEVTSADEVFLTNSSFGVLPVVGIEGKTIAGGGVGQLTRAILQSWRGAVSWVGE